MPPPHAQYPVPRPTPPPRPRPPPPGEGGTPSRPRKISTPFLAPVVSLTASPHPPPPHPPRPCQVWPLAQFINHSYVPLKLRVLYSNCVALAWSIFIITRARASVVGGVLLEDGTLPVLATVAKKGN
jgi:hypothetical protein